MLQFINKEDQVTATLMMRKRRWKLWKSIDDFVLKRAFLKDDSIRLTCHAYFHLVEDSLISLRDKYHEILSIFCLG